MDQTALQLDLVMLHQVQRTAEEQRRPGTIQDSGQRRIVLPLRVQESEDRRQCIDYPSCFLVYRHKARSQGERRFTAHPECKAGS